MVPDAIEREILIAAPIETVWRVVTEPEQIRQWFTDQAEVELRVGGGGHLRFPSGDSYSLQVEAVDPPRRFVWRWVQPEGSVARQENSLVVEFTLWPEGDGTRLRVVESGFDKLDWSDERKQKYADDHTHGWEAIVDRLRDRAERS